MQDLSLRRLQTNTFLEFARLLGLEQSKIASLFKERGLTKITPTQARVLMILFQEKRPMKARELAAEMGVSEPTMARFVKSLTTNGWLQRRQSEEDKRAYDLRPTDKAYAALGDFIAVSNQLMDDVFEGLEEHELRCMRRCLQRMRENLGA